MRAKGVVLTEDEGCGSSLLAMSGAGPDSAAEPSPKIVAACSVSWASKSLGLKIAQKPYLGRPSGPKNPRIGVLRASGKASAALAS